MKSWKTRICSVLLTLTTLLFFLTGCSLPGSDDNLIRYNISVNVDNLDPQYISTANETLLILNCFKGLMKLDANGRPVTALAERYTLSEDKRVYTFYLREGLKWSDGEPLTAGDFVFAFRRLFNPDSPSPSAGDFRSMENADAILSGQLAVSRLGIRASDDRTLEIRLSEPDSFFLELLATPAAMPCREDFFLSCNGRYGLSLKFLRFNGPYVMTTWKSGRYIGLRPNEEYYDPLSLPTAAVNLYTVRPAGENAQLLLEDRCDGGPVLFEDLESLEGFSTVSFQSTVHLLVFNPELTVFQDNDIRLGMCTAINRQLFQPDIPDNLEITNLLIPPAAAILGQPYRSLAKRVTGLVYQRDEAKELFETGLERLELSKLPRSNMICLETGQHRFLAGYLQRQWQKDLNLYINLEPLSEEKFYSRLSRGDYQLAILPVSLDQSNPRAMLARLTQYLPYTDTLPEETEEEVPEEEKENASSEEEIQPPQPYSTAAADKEALELYLSLAGSGGASEAAQWFAKAEELLLKRGYVAPLYFESHYFSVSPRVTDIHFTPYPGWISFQEAKKK